MKANVRQILLFVIASSIIFQVAMKKPAKAVLTIKVPAKNHLSCKSCLIDKAGLRDIRYQKSFQKKHSYEVSGSIGQFYKARSLCESSSLCSELSIKTIEETALATSQAATTKYANNVCFRRPNSDYCEQCLSSYILNWKTRITLPLYTEENRQKNYISMFSGFSDLKILAEKAKFRISKFPCHWFCAFSLVEVSCNDWIALMQSQVSEGAPNKHIKVPITSRIHNQGDQSVDVIESSAIRLPAEDRHLCLIIKIKEYGYNRGNLLNTFRTSVINVLGDLKGTHKYISIRLSESDQRTQQEITTDAKKFIDCVPEQNIYNLTQCHQHTFNALEYVDDVQEMELISTCILFRYSPKDVHVCSLSEKSRQPQVFKLSDSSRLELFDVSQGVDINEEIRRKLVWSTLAACRIVQVSSDVCFWHSTLMKSRTPPRHKVLLHDFDLNTPAADVEMTQERNLAPQKVNLKPLGPKNLHAAPKAQFKRSKGKKLIGSLHLDLEYYPTTPNHLWPSCDKESGSLYAIVMFNFNESNYNQCYNCLAKMVEIHFIAVHYEYFWMTRTSKAIVETCSSCALTQTVANICSDMRPTITVVSPRRLRALFKESFMDQTRPNRVKLNISK